MNANATVELPERSQRSDLEVIWSGFDSTVHVLGGNLEEAETGTAVTPSATYPRNYPWTDLRGIRLIPPLVDENVGHIYIGADYFRRILFEFLAESSTAILSVSFQQENGASSEFEEEYQKVIVELQSGGREIVADDLIELLRIALEDPEEPKIRPLSLQAMAQFLIRNRAFDDPIIGPDSMGFMQAEWHIIGDGLLVLAFLQDDLIHCVAQSDATSECEALNRSVRMTEDEALEEFGKLVPPR